MKKIITFTHTYNGVTTTRKYAKEVAEQFADPAVARTEQRYRDTARELRSVYEEAANDLYAKQQSFLSAHKQRVMKYREQLQKGEITQADYDAWMRGQVFQEKAWEQKRDQIARTMVDIDKRAMQIVNTGKLDVFADNANYIGYSLETGAGANLGFGVYDRNSVMRLITKKPDLLPMPEVDEGKDYVYYNKVIRRAITQGIIQGEDLEEIVFRIATETGETGLSDMRRNARTAYTGAQNAGRVEGMRQARDELGIKVQKRWMAFLDKHTRETHADADGQVVEQDEPFVLSDGDELMYPGDPAGRPENVYNCRCTLGYEHPEYPTSLPRVDDTGENVGDMTYREWQESKRNADTSTAEYMRDKARFEKLRGKYKDATSAMLFGTPEEAAEFVRTQNSVYQYAAGHGDYKTAYETQPITEQTLESWRTQPTQEQKDAISTYSRNGYKGMNDYLRHGGSLQGVKKSEIDALQSYLTENTTKQDMFLKRGISVRSLNEMLGEGWQEDTNGLAGKRVTDKGFMSTSPFSDGTFGKNAVMYLKAPDGTQGAYIADIIGGEKKTEHEFLLPHDTTVKITRAYTMENKYGDTIPVIEVVIDKR